MPLDDLSTQAVPVPGGAPSRSADVWGGLVLIPAEQWEMNGVKSTWPFLGLFAGESKQQNAWSSGRAEPLSLQDVDGMRGQGKRCDLSHLCCLFAEQRQERGGRMNVGTAHSEVNPNTRVMNSRGIWLSYVLAIGLLHVVLLSIPFVSVPVVWTLTNLIHNMVRACLLPAQALGAEEGEEPPQLWARCQGDVLTTSVPGPQTQPSSQSPRNFWVPAVCTLRTKICGSMHIPRMEWLVDLEGGPLGPELRAPEVPSLAQKCPSPKPRSPAIFHSGPSAPAAPACSLVL